MNSPDRVTGVDATTSASRRKVLKAAVAGAGLAALPGARVLAATVGSKIAPIVSMGYCRSSNSAIVDALSVPSARGMFELRVVGAGTPSPFALVAEYAGNAVHYFWQAWSRNGLLQRSAPVAINWNASKANPLPLTVQSSNTSSLTEVAAQPGLYVLTIVPGTQRPPAWSSLGLRSVSSGGVSMKLVSLASGAELAIPYALFAVRQYA